MREVKHCVPCTFIIIVSNAFLLFLGAIMLFMIYKGIFAIGVSSQNRIALFLGGAMGGVLFASLLYRAFVMGVWGVCYDNYEITFMLTKKDRRTYRWSDLDKSGISLTPDFCFHFPDKKTMGINPAMTNYHDFKQTLQQQIRKNHLTDFRCPF